MITANDITFVYSGGSGNNLPDQSLGGEPSVYDIRDGLNNLFRDVTDDQADDGFTSYRCFYMYNNSLVDTFSTVTVQMNEIVDTSIGFRSANDVQLLTISGTVTAGSLTLDYEGNEFTFDYDADIDIWASNMQTAMNDLDVLSGVGVVGSVSGTDYFFTVTFAGADYNRNHMLLELISNDLVGSPTISVIKQTEGGPINLLATEIAVETVTPAYVEFDQPITTAIEIGNMRPGDGVSLWVKRQILAGATPVSDETVTFTFDGV
jgi:hypothetical protein